MAEFPRRMVIEMVENGYLVREFIGYSSPSGREWVFTNSASLGAWLRDNAPKYGLAGNDPPSLQEPGK